MPFFDYIKNAPKFFELFKEGKEITNATTWKNRTIATNAVLALLGTALALAKAFGFKLELDSETLQGLAAGTVAVVTAVNAVMHTITSARVGVSSNSGSNPPEGPTADVGQSPAV
jgi:hypothetical protein